MTESAWLALTRIGPMKGFALHHPKATPRRRALFACACCRLAQDWGLPDLESDAIDATERHADGELSSRTCLRRCRALLARDPIWERSANPWDRDFRRAVASLSYAASEWSVSGDLLSSVARISSPEYAEAFELKYCSALRDIFGDLFRTVAFAAEWRTDTVTALAKQVYKSGDYSAVPILADALQDAGCEDDAILGHCRDATQVHVRGCWVIDLVLGKS